MIDAATFKPKTVYVIYIASTREKVWQALTDSELSQQYFHGSLLEIEPKVGGNFVVRFPDGRVNVKGTVVEWSPPRRLATTWTVEWMPELRELPECLVSYDIEQVGESVKLTLTEFLFVGGAGCVAFRRANRLASAPFEPQERARDRQAAGHQDGGTTGNDGGDEAGYRRQAVAEKLKSAIAYRKLALNLSSTAEPGHSSFSPSALSGASTVARWPCRSCASGAT